MELCCTPKTQHTTVNYKQNTTYTSNLYGLGTLTPIEFFQQHLFWSSSNTNWPSKPIQSRRQQNSLLWKSITAFLHCSATTELRQSSIVASYRRRNNVVLVHCYLTGHRRHLATETITCNNTMMMNTDCCSCCMNQKLRKAMMYLDKVQNADQTGAVTARERFRTIVPRLSIKHGVFKVNCKGEGGRGASHIASGLYISQISLCMRETVFP
jgi:hypothetical protein